MKRNKMKRSKQNIKHIKNERKHEELLNTLDSVIKQYSKLRKDSFARALKAILDIIVASGDLSVEQLRKGVDFPNTEMGRLSKCLLMYLGEHPLLLKDEMISSAEKIANSDIDINTEEERGEYEEEEE